MSIYSTALNVRISVIMCNSCCYTLMRWNALHKVAGTVGIKDDGSAVAL